ncbi:hypothetical protein C8Q74DRAFT_568972 [Fomes fomentarius]|nr:hypothetical protein C8Q74DRAFT_568972 [Fomes fomentarius]
MIYQESLTCVSYKTWKWVRNEVCGLLKEARKERLKGERKSTLRARFASLQEAVLAHYVSLPKTPLMDCRPAFLDFALSSAVRMLIQQPNADCVTASSFSAIIPEVATQLEEQRKRILKRFFMKHLHPAPDGPHVLQLATAVVACNGNCHSQQWRTRMVFRYPAIISHPCWSSSLLENGDDYTLLARKSLPVINNSSQCTCTQSELFQKPSKSATLRAINAMRNIVRAMGLDPDRATIDDVERSGARVECLVCLLEELVETAGMRTAYTWEAALQHSLKDDQPTRHNEWQCVPEDHMPVVRALEAREHTLHKDAQRHVWVCSLCPNWDGAYYTMQDHLRGVQVMTS